jgi:hypothetical protein
MMGAAVWRKPIDDGAKREGNMLSGMTVLVVSLATLAVIWIAVLLGSQYFGSPPEH